MSAKSAYNYKRVPEDFIVPQLEDHAFTDPEGTHLSKEADPYAYKVVLGPASGRTWADVADSTGLPAASIAVQLEWSNLPALWRRLRLVALPEGLLHSDQKLDLIAEIPWYQHGPENRIRIRLVSTQDRPADSTLAARFTGTLLWEWEAAVKTTGLGEFLDVRFDNNLQEAPCRVEFDGKRYVLIVSGKHCPVANRKPGGGAHGALAAALEEMLRNACRYTEDGADESDAGEDDQDMRAVIGGYKIGRSTVRSLVEKGDPDNELRNFCWDLAEEASRALYATEERGGQNAE
jgi:hypothetical protein